MTYHALLHRNVAAILPTVDGLELALKHAETEGRILRAYLGLDPSSPHLHIGHSIPLRKLAHVQDAGHQAILLIGDFTARLGDPTDKGAVRVALTKEQVEGNMQSYLAQVAHILDLKGEQAGHLPVEIRYNSEWSDDMTFSAVVKLAENFTVQQMLERDMFAKRLLEQKPISLSEFFYPLMQGYDAVALEADIQIGGTDQTFNMLAGRTLNRILRQKEMFVLATPLLADKNGVKIGKTQGNAINIDNPANELFGQLMSLPDETIEPGLTYLTDMPEGEISLIHNALNGGENPMEFKKQLAFIVVESYHGKEVASEAADHFYKTVQQGQTPDEVEERVVDGAEWDILDLLMTLGATDSRSDARRLVQGGAVEIDGQRLESNHISLAESTLLKVGKRQYFKLHVSEQEKNL